MFKRFIRILSFVLIISLLWNMLPVSVLGAELRATQDEAETPVALEPGIIEETEEPEDITIIGELTDRRTENIKEYLLSNGNTLAAVYGNPVHYQEDGQWKDIDNTLTAKADGTYINTAGAWDVSFPQTLSNANRITITKDGYTLSFGMAGQLRQGNAVIRAGENVLYTTEAGNVPTLTVSAASISQAQIQQVDLTEVKAEAKHPQLVQEKLASRLAYSQVYANTDIIYDLDSNRVKESIILSQYDSTLRGYRYTLNTGGMIPVLAADGHIEFYDARGEEIILTMPAPFLVDADLVYNWDIEVSLTGGNGTYTLTYLLPQSWLAAEERAWPVVLDPEVQAGSSATTIADQTVFSYGSEDYRWEYLLCGRDASDIDEVISRFYLKFTNLPTLTSADVVVDAEVALYCVENDLSPFYVGVHSVTGSWSSSGITWSNKPGYNTKAADFVLLGNRGTYRWNITDIVREWYQINENPNNNFGMMFKASVAEESLYGTNEYALFYSSDSSINKPQLTIEYRNTTGLEDYWDYTSASAGRAGTAYVNAFSGNLVFVRNLMAFGGNRMPVSIDLVYNASEKGVNNFGVGNGWRTNYSQRIFPFGSDYYVWEDADGTQHYFRYDATKGAYYDEDNLNLVITEDYTVDTIIMTDLAGNTSTFEMAGRLIKIQNNQETPSSINITYVGDTNRISQITDGVGRKYVFTYTNNLLTRISYHAAGTSELHYVNLSYTNGNLTGITDKDNNACSYEYSGTLLMKASDPHGAGLSFTYQSASPNRITEVEALQITGENDTKIYEYGNSIEFSYNNMWTEVTDTQGNKQRMQFNAYGNTVSVQNDEGGATFAEYATDKSKTAKKNQLTWSSGLQGTVVDLLANGNFEKDVWYTVDGDAAVDYDYSGYLDTNTLHIEHLEDTPVAVNFEQFTVLPGTTYTLSAYLKMDSGSICLRFINGSTVYATSTSLTGNNSSQWKRLTLSYTNTTETAVTVTPQVYIDSGYYIYIDGVQLEKSSTVGKLNLLENGDFTVAASNADLFMWTQSNLASNDGRYTLTSSAVPALDNNVMKITGDPVAQKRVSQRIDICGNAGDVFTIAGWGKGYVPQTAATYYGQRQFGIELTFYYSDGKVGDETTFQFNPHTEGWQYIVGQAVAPGKFYYVVVTLLLDYNVGTVCFDGIQLFAEGSGNTYTYNDNGDVETVTNSEGLTTQYGYTGRDLTSVINCDGSIVSYVYDAYKNVKTETTTYLAESADGDPVYRITEYIYDTYGNICQNVKKVKIGSFDPVPISISSATYTTNGNYPLTVTDENDNTTTYDYDGETGVLKSVQDPEGNSSYYTYDLMFRQIESLLDSSGGTMSVQNSYSGDQLLGVTTGSTAYSFSYGTFGSTQSVSAGEHLLASYEYDTYQNLSDLIYGNGAQIEYSYDSKGRVTEEQYINGAETKTVTYAYDELGKLIRTNDELSGRTTLYTYDAQNRLLKTEVWEGSTFLYAVGYVYDSLGRLTRKLDYTNRQSNTPTAYYYNNQHRIWSVSYDWAHQLIEYNSKGQPDQIIARHSGTNTVSHQYAYNSLSEISSHTLTYAGNDTTYAYEYDNLGNITQITVSTSNGSTTATKLITYIYDEAGQLLRENNQPAGYSWVMTYDDAGNMQSRTKYAYTTGALGTPLSTQTFAYEDSTWGDLLTGINGTTVTSDTIGNILSDGTSTYTWKNGRQLATATKNGTTWTFTYDASGMRTKRTNGSTTYTYFYDGSNLHKMKVGSDTLTFIYGSNGHPMAVKYNYYYYYYVTNTFGDVLAILDDEGAEVVAYSYDAWGNILSTSGSMASTLGAYNPLRYRSYVYDQETGLYYLQSRYYNPTIGRFISADSFVSTGQGVLGYNMFAYCGNNPANYADPFGTWTISLVIGADITAFFFGVSASIGIAFDDNGNIAIQYSESVPNYLNNGETVHFGILDAGIGLSLQVTEDDTIYNLEGPAAYAGFSVGRIAYAGIDMVYSGVEVLNRQQNNSLPNGMQLNFGFGLGIDAHIKQTQTQILWILN